MPRAPCAAPLLLLAVGCAARAPHRPPPEHLSHLRRVAARGGGGGCPCRDASLCRPAYRPNGTFAREREVFGFASGGARQHTHYDWSVVSTVAWASGDEVMCEAHAHGARVIMSAPHIDLPMPPAERAAWVSDAVATAKAGHYDGVTFDYESPIAANETEKMQSYVSLIREAAAAFHAEIPGSQVSTCVAWSPDDIDGRAYDNVGLSEASDLLYLMVYDTRSQIFDRCIASANSPAPIAERALQRWGDIGVPAAKLVLGVPWYAYDYPCTAEMEGPTSKYCPIAVKPFRGVACSDAAGREVDYSRIAARIDGNTTATGRLWEATLQNPYYNYAAADGTTHQVWYDDPESLSPKYRLARARGLRGTGPFTFDMLDYDTAAGRARAAAMWAALHDFTD